MLKTKITKKLLFAIALSWCFVLFPKVSFAQEIENSEEILENEETFQSLEESQIEDIYINEVYPNPVGTDVTGVNEWIEIYNPNNVSVNLKDYIFQRAKDSGFYDYKITEELIVEPQSFLLIYPTFSITNKNGAIQIQNDGGLIIDNFTYDLAESIGEDLSLSYFSETDDFLISSPTPNFKNIYVNLEFSTFDENNVEKENFDKGEIVFIENKSVIYGAGNSEIKWFLDGVKILNYQILTEDLNTGKHSITAKLGEIENEKNFYVNENYEGLEISEVLANPSGKDLLGENEWIEIYNSSSREINPNNLFIERFTETQSYKFTIENQQVIKPNEYLVIYPNFSITNNSFNLRLVDTKQTIINTFPYSQEIGEEESIILFDGEIVSTTTSTKAYQNILTTDEIEEENSESNEKEDFSQIEISEIYPNPEGDDKKGENEWIELYNSRLEKVNLKRLIIAQATSTNHQFVIEKDLFINPHSFILIYLNFSISNSGAKFQLKDGVGIVDEVFYDEEVKAEQSLIRQDGTTKLSTTTIPTPENVNIQSGSVLSAEDIETIPIEDAKNQNEEAFVKVKGAVTVEPDLLGNDIFYIQDETGGIQIDLNGNTSNYLQKDVIVEIEGKLNSYHEELKIEVSENTITPINQAEVIIPKFVKIGEIDVGLIGTLITIEGYVAKTSGSSFYVADKTGTVKVQIKDSTEIVRPECRKNYYAKVSGILSVWDLDENGNPNYRILPRYQEDVFISKTLAKTGGKNYLGLLAGIIFISSSFFLYRKLTNKLYFKSLLSE